MSEEMIENKEKEELETFEYTYSSSRQAELDRIRKKYTPAGEPEMRDDKLEQIRKLDRDAEKKGTVPAVIAGAMGCLLLGLGMSATLALAGAWFIPGIIVGILGIVIMALALPLNRYLIQRERERIAPKILALTEELMRE